MKSSRRVYVSLLWNERTKNVDFQQTSLERDVIVAAGIRQLSRLDVPELGYKTFLADRLRSWDGATNLVTTLTDHKLLLLVDDLSIDVPRPAIPQMEAMNSGGGS